MRNGLLTKMTQTPKPKERFYELDLFRFLAALFVLLHHYLFRGQASDGYSPVTFAPWLTLVGQYLFFLYDQWLRASHEYV
jgi:peptidoglycan/LPS O-acetylase OafA/YrhL